MTFSRPIKAAKTKMNWFEYWIGHCWMTGWQSIGSTFRIWSELMTSKYHGYALLKEDDPETECIEWFWVSLGEDDTYPKEFLEYLMDLCDKIQSGEEKVYPFDLDALHTLDELLKDDDNQNRQSS